MAYCFCDFCDYKDECKHYRKVVVCPYIKNGGIVMGVSRRAYQELIDGDIEWLLRQPRDLERDHIEEVLRKSVELLYGKEE